MEEEGKYKELNTELTTKIDKLQEQNAYFMELENKERDNLLGKLPEDDREDFVDLPLNQLSKVVNKFKTTEVIKPEIPSVKGAIKNVSINKPFSSMNEAEREVWHNEQTAHLRK